MKHMPQKSKMLLALTCFLNCVETLTTTLCLYFMADILELAQAGQKREMIFTIALAVGLLLLTYLLNIASTVSRLGYLSHSEVCLKEAIMKNLLARPWQGFRRQNGAYYLNLLTTDTDMYRTDRLDSVTGIYSAVFSVVASAVMLFVLSPWLFLAGVVISMAPLLLNNFFSRMQQKTKAQYSKQSEQYTNTLKETVEGHETIHIHGDAAIFLNRFEQASEKKQKAYFSYAFSRNMNAQTLYMVASLANIVGIAVGGFLVLQGLLSAAMMLAATGYFSSIANGFSNAIEEIITIRSTKGIAGKLSKEQECPCPSDSGQQLGLTSTVSYDDVSFGFEDRQLYSHFQKTFQPGECYAIVGESGSGKSTLVKLLLKYYEDYTGTIRLDGVDIRQLSEREIFSRVTMVSQTPFLFNASLYDNITMFSGQPERHSEAYQSLLRALNLVELAEQVWDRPLGDFGDTISGGERQRICMARALRNHAEIMIFDEPTTGLDPENVRLIQEFIFNLRDVTRIVITHDRTDAFLNRFDQVIHIGQ